MGIIVKYWIIISGDTLEHPENPFHEEKRIRCVY